MADSYLPYQNPSTTDKKLDSESVSVGANDVERERVQIAGSGASEIAAVKNTDPASNAYGSVVRDPGLNSRIGEVQASPTANTVLDRLKALLTGIVLAAGSNLIGKVKLRNPGDTVDIGDSTNPVRTDPTGTTTQPVSASSLPLPSGAATSAKQDTGNTSLSNLETKIGEVQASPTSNTVLDRLKALLTGIVLAAGSNRIGKVTVRNSADGADIDPLSESDFDTKVGSLTEAAPASDTASSGLNGRLQRIAQRITSLIALVPAALTGSGNFKAALVEDTTSNKTVDLNKVAGAATDVNNGASGAGTQRVTIANDSTPIGALTEAAPASDTASSGLNGRLQRIAQRLTSLIALVPSALTGSGNFKAALVEDTTSNKSVNMAQVGGNNVDVNSGNKGNGTQRVVIATDQPALSTPMPTKETRASTPAQSSVAGSASSVSLLASNANRLGATIYNDSTVNLYVRLGSTASTSNFTVKLAPGDYYEVPFNYTGAIDGIWDSATGNARITELT